MILAGGRSSRMGQDKALISLGGERLIQRTCGVALACAEEVYVVTPWPERYRPLVPEAVQFILEAADSTDAPAGGRGPLLAVSYGVGALPRCPDWLLVLACDMPNLRVPVLQAWQADLAALPPNINAYLPQRQGRWEPLCGFYRAAALLTIGSGLAAGLKGPSFQRWLGQTEVASMPRVPEEMLANLNNPEDLATWQRSRKAEI